MADIIYNTNEPPEIRGTGRSTNQILTAPKGAIYVCMGGRAGHEAEIAKTVKRQDLIFVSPTWFEHRSFRGLNKFVVIDHAITPVGVLAKDLESHNAFVTKY